MVLLIGDESNATPASDNKLTFGCYKGHTYQWLYENDGEYWTWCMKNISWFRDKVHKLVC